MFPKKFLILALAIIVLVVLAAVWLGFKFLGSSEADGAGASDYSAVYMATGDIYYGKLSWFPWPRLSNVWFLQRGVDQSGQQQLGLSKFTTAFWAPIDKVYLNPKQVIFWTSLRNDSQVAQALANPEAVQNTQSPADFQGPPGPPPSAE